MATTAPFYRWGDRGTERLSHLSTVSWPISGRAGTKRGLGPKSSDLTAGHTVGCKVICGALGESTALESGRPACPFSLWHMLAVADCDWDAECPELRLTESVPRLRGASTSGHTAQSDGKKRQAPKQEDVLNS